jgi:CHASE2 domain-containing sensor protein/tRNA A-37 threonylcarbamoyl transferase component Bud32
MTGRYSGFILYVLVTVLVISVFLDPPQSLQRIEQFIQDTMFRLRGEQPASGDLAVVGIDDASLESLGEWPWNRDLIASLVDAIASQGAKTIVLNLSFDADEYQKRAGYTDSLAAAMARAGNVIAGYYYSQTDLPLRGDNLPDGLVRSAYTNFDNPKKFARFPPTGASTIKRPEAEIADSAANVGYINVMLDNDNKVRWQPLIMGYRGNFYPSASVVAAAHYLGIQRSKIGVRVGRSIMIGGRNIPTDPAGRLFLNFSGPEGTFKSYSAADILNRMTAPRELQGKLVIVTYTAFASTNVYSTPVSRNLPGGEVLATAAENIVHGNFLKGVSNQFRINLFMLIAIGLFCALVLPRVSLINRIAILLLFFVVQVNMNYVLFSTFNIVIKSLYPAMQIVIMLMMVPLIKPPSAYSQKRTEDEEEEIDYEALLSSSDRIPVGDVTASQPAYNYDKTVAQGKTVGRSTVIGTAADTHAGSGTVPLGSPGTDSVAVASHDHFGRYRILGSLGKGAMGMVYKGLDPAIDRPVALKTIRVDQIFEPGEVNELRERLSREAKAAGKLSHPNIVTIYDVGEDGNVQYIAMEFLMGNTLETLLRDGLSWDYKTISKVMMQVCDALDYAHENGIVHRDVKPANIMILDGHRVKVMDFGIARVDKSASMTHTGTALGTPNYISPEQLKGQIVDRRSDIFSLGVVFYEILTNQKPFKGETISALIYSILHTEPAPPSEVNLEVPRIFDKIIAKALVKDPDLRFQKAGDVADILRKLI